jgi:hypothetical protein
MSVRKIWMFTDVRWVGFHPCSFSYLKLNFNFCRSSLRAEIQWTWKKKRRVETLPVSSVQSTEPQPDFWSTDISPEWPFPDDKSISCDSNQIRITENEIFDKNIFGVSEVTFRLNVISLKVRAPQERRQNTEHNDTQHNGLQHNNKKANLVVILYLQIW